MNPDEHEMNGNGNGNGDQAERRGWHFSRTLSLDSLLAVGAAALAVIFFGTTLDKRLTVIEEQYRILKEIISSTDQANKERQQRIEDTVKEQGRLMQQLLTLPRAR